MVTVLIIALVSQVNAATQVWSLGDEPLVVIDDDGTPARQFQRIVAVARLSGERIAVVDGGSNEIRIFDGIGRHRTTFGRTGGGPGEFRRIQWVGRSGDTTWFYDSNQRRLTMVILGEEPVLAGIQRVEATGGGQSFYVSGRLPGGRWVVSTYVTPSLNGPPGAHRVPSSIGVIGPKADGEVDWLGDFHSAAIFIHNPDNDIRRATVGPIAFSPWLFHATVGPGIWIGESSGDSLVLVNSTNLARSIVRLPLTRRPPGRALVDSEKERELETVRSAQSRSFMEAKYSARYLPTDLPLFEKLIPGDQGEVWVQEYAGQGSAPANYLIIDSKGTLRGRLAVPGGARVGEVGPDYVLLIRQDADGVESVELRQLRRR